MFSFNDDSAIGAASERSYHSWLNICRNAGGYLDEHKTYTSTGVQFCEMHQFKDLKNNFKFVSAFKTLSATLIDCFTWDQWRFQVSDCWDQIRGFDSDISGTVPWRHFIGTMEHYIKMMGSAYWGLQELPEGPPELGGVAIGYTFRTDYSLKNTLILLENMKGWDLIKAQNYLRASKEAFSHTPQFRPWKRMPHGPTRTYMLALGKYSGLHHELESFSMKAHNKFITNTTWYKLEFWRHYALKVQEAQAQPIIDHEFWLWCKQERWPSYAIPSAFVTKEVILPPTQRVLPFVRMNKVKAKYSLPSMMEAYLKYMQGNVVLNIPIQEISFIGYLLWEAPVLGDSDHYRPLCNMELISQIAEFSDPRRTFLDYWWRNNSVPTELDIPDFKSDAALDLISLIEGTDIRNLGYDKATWYTNIPLPYKSCWSSCLTANLPDLHESIIMQALADGSLITDETAVYLKEDIDNDRRQNKKFWKEKTRSKKRSGQKRKLELGHRAPAQTITEDEPLTLLNMDDIREVMDRVRDKFIPEPEVSTPRQIVEVSYRYDWGSIPEPTHGYTEILDEPEYDWEQEEDEDSLIAAALDRLTSRSDFGYDPG
jgi:hypothetical protein